MDELVTERFEELSQVWREETAYVSSLQQIVAHPAYQEIIKMGYAIVPLIIDSLRKEPEHWFWALNKIVGEDLAKGTTTMQAAALCWIDWYGSKVAPQE